MPRAVTRVTRPLHLPETRPKTDKNTGQNNWHERTKAICREGTQVDIDGDIWRMRMNRWANNWGRAFWEEEQL